MVGVVENTKEVKMSRVTEIKNNSKDPVSVKLIGGPIITLTQGASIKNVDVENMNDLRGNVKIKIKEDLTEVGSSTGKQKLYD